MPKQRKMKNGCKSFKVLKFQVILEKKNPDSEF